MRMRYSGYSLLPFMPRWAVYYITPWAIKKFAKNRREAWHAILDHDEAYRAGGIAIDREAADVEWMIRMVTNAKAPINLIVPWYRMVRLLGGKVYKYRGSAYNV